MAFIFTPYQLQKYDFFLLYDIKIHKIIFTTGEKKLEEQGIWRTKIRKLPETNFF